MRKFAVLLYPDFSLQEITCLTSKLTVRFGEKIDYIASENKEYCSEDGLRVIPTKTTADAFDFVEKDNFIHNGIVEDGNVVTGIGMFFREFAEAVLRRFGYDIGTSFMRDNPDEYTEEELTFYWSDDDYREFLEKLKAYTT